MAFNFVRLDRVLAMKPPASVGTSFISNERFIDFIYSVLDVIGLVTSVRRIKPELIRITLVDVSRTKVFVLLFILKK
jgi:hypothetical protein